MAAAQGTAARLVEVALAELGTAEGPKDNQTKYGAFTKANFLPWCGSFCMWSANQAGVTLPNTVSTVAGATAFKKIKQWTDAANAAPQPGDIVYFDFSKGMTAGIQHVGIVVKDNGDGSVTTIEGNTAGNEKGSQNNGGEVAKKVRAYKANKKSLPVFVVGFGRPVFGAAAEVKVEKAVDTTGQVYPGETIDPGEAGIHIATVKKALGVKPADGQYGPVTKKAVIAFQEKNPKLGAADGIIGPKTWNAITGLPIK